MANFLWNILKKTIQCLDCTSKWTVMRCTPLLVSTFQFSIFSFDESTLFPFLFLKTLVRIPHPSLMWVFSKFSLAMFSKRNHRGSAGRLFRNFWEWRSCKKTMSSNQVIVDFTELIPAWQPFIKIRAPVSMLIGTLRSLSSLALLTSHHLFGIVSSAVTWGSKISNSPLSARLDKVRYVTFIESLSLRYICLWPQRT